MFKHRIYSALLVICLVTFLISCAAQPPKRQAEDYYSFTDSNGQTITLSEKPKKVAVLFSSLADIWVLAGGQVDITVGESISRGIVTDEAELVDTGAGKTLNTERLLSLEPDFVICSSEIAAQDKCAELLLENGISAARFNVNSFEDYLRVLKIFTDITGDSAAYAKYGTEIKEKTKAKLASLKPLSKEKPNILFIRSGSGAASAKAKTAKNNFVCAMLDEIGTHNIADSAPVLTNELSFEAITQADPDFIFISTMGNEAAAKKYMDSVLKQDTWQSLTAIKEGKYCYLPKDMFMYKPNARWYEAYCFLIDLVYGKGE